MNKKWIMTMALVVLMSWASGAFAENFVNIGNWKATYHPVQFSVCPQGDPMDSILILRGKINMGQTNYFSVMPGFGESPIMIDDVLYGGMLITDAAIFPQLKSSEGAGWVICLYARTGHSPIQLQRFKDMKNVRLMSSGMVAVTLQQNGDKTFVPATPQQGAMFSKNIGPMQPK